MNLISVLFSPGKTFERLRERGGWAVGFIVLLILSMVAVFLDWPLIEKTTRAKLEEIGTVPNIDAALKISHYSAYFGAAAGVAATIFVGALLLLLVNLIVRGEAKYMQLVKVFTFAYVPTVISSLLTGILAYTSDADDIKDLAISAGAFMTDKKGFLFGVANMINPFTIWTVVLLVIGTAVMAGKPKSSVAVWIVLGWVAIGLAGAALGALGS